MCPLNGQFLMYNIKTDMSRFIYADNAATTKIDPEAFESMLPFLQDMYGNASQPYMFARPAKQAIKDAREIIAHCINAEPNEIYFTSGGSESDNWALKGTYFATKKNIITSSIEHHAVLNTVSYLKKFGCSVTYLPVDKYGVVSPQTLNDCIKPNDGIVSVMLANNEIGTIEPIQQLSKIAHEHNCLFHTDAVQAVGHIKIDVQALGVDMLSASAHKFNGPKGVGFLYKKNGVEIDNLIHGGTQEYGNRAGTENIALIIGMATALKNNINNIDEHQNKLQFLDDLFMKELSETNIDFVRNGSYEQRLPGNINLSIKDADGEALLHRLDLKGICVSTGAACDSVNTQTSHVLQAIGIEKSYANGTIRISLGKNNTIQDVHYIVNALSDILVTK